MLSDRAVPPHELTLTWIPGRFGLARLAPDAAIPTWLEGKGFVSVTRTEDELSIVAPFERVPAELAMASPLRAARVRGTLDLGLVGILAGLTAPLAQAGIPIFAISTVNTDYILVAADLADRASMAWIEAGVHIEEQ